MKVVGGELSNVVGTVLIIPVVVGDSVVVVVGEGLVRLPPPPPGLPEVLLRPPPLPAPGLFLFRPPPENSSPFSARPLNVSRRNAWSTSATGSVFFFMHGPPSNGLCVPGGHLFEELVGGGGVLRTLRIKIMNVVTCGYYLYYKLGCWHAGVKAKFCSRWEFNHMIHMKRFQRNILFA